MIARLSTVLVAFAAASSALSVERQEPTTLCGTTSTIPASDEQKVQTRIKDIKAGRVSTGASGARAGAVPVAFHAITCNGQGSVSSSTLSSQMSVMNSDFSGTGFSFYLASSDSTENCDWFYNVAQGNTQEREMKTALRRGGAATLNFYTVSFSNGLLGYATFPSSYSSQPWRDGIVDHVGSLPGGSQAPYNTGRTAVHETGHWLGLYHVFQGGCASPGDYVSDTPPQSTVTRGCPTYQDSCSGGGVDSISNHMDYSQDSCRTKWTAGQIERMKAQTSLYRGF